LIPQDIRELLAPLERFESIRRRAVKIGPHLADLSYANPYDGPRAQARAAIRTALDDERTLDLQYTPFGGQTLARRAIADHLRSMTDRQFEFGDVILTPGAMAALQVALRVVGTQGDEVIIPVPCWLDYPLYVRSLGMIPVLVPLAPPRFELDADSILAAITPRTRAVLLSHPTNPTGRMHGEDSLARLGAAIAAGEVRSGQPITLISDETHRDFAEAHAFATAATFVARTLIVYSFGKYHFIQGQRLGYVAVGPDHPSREVRHELVQWTRISGHATPTSLMQRAVPALLGLRYQLDWLSDLRGRMETALTSAGYEVVQADATLFMYVRTPPGFDDFAFTEQLAARGLLVLPAPVFHHRGYFRLALTASGDMLNRAQTVLEDQIHRAS
jgi:aspartate aminotransferase